ncbi:MAG: hypothetical protein HKN87_01345 [Saprospiraceae bacterium]|nr:hypothetical protein [Saprospiraceae bacterium]
MLYTILRQLVATVFKVYFRKIYLVGKEKIPSDDPVLISCNHPMAFTEACLLACFLDRPLYFLVRGDVFDSKWDWFLEKTHQIPIYRFRDGFSNMRRNASSFAWAHQALSDGKAILIFSEGNTKLQKKLSPLQKGLARLAFGAFEERNVRDLKIIPIGVNYANGTAFRSDVMIQVGDPVDLGPYLSVFQSDGKAAARRLTEDLYQKMLPLVIHLDRDEDEPLASQLFEALDNQMPDEAWPIVDRDDRRFRREKALADEINRLDTFGIEEARAAYGRQLKEIGDIKSLRRSMKGIILFVLAPIAFLGFFVNLLPFYCAKMMAEKKVRKVEFYTPVRLGLHMVIYIIWMLLMLIVLMYWVGWNALWIVFLLPLAGYVTLIWWEGFCRPVLQTEDFATSHA